MSASRFFYKLSRGLRDYEVLTGKNGPKRYVKRRARRVWRRWLLGGLNRRTGL